MWGSPGGQAAEVVRWGVQWFLLGEAGRVSSFRVGRLRGPGPGPSCPSGAQPGRSERESPMEEVGAGVVQVWAQVWAPQLGGWVGWLAFQRQSLSLCRNW